MRLCCMRSPKSVRHYILGGKPAEVTRLVDALRRHNAGLEIVGSHPGAFSPGDEDAIVADINRCQPHILWNCLPTTRREYVAERWKSKVSAKVTLLVGAGFDFDHILAQIERAGRHRPASAVRWFFRSMRRSVRRTLLFVLSVPLAMLAIWYDLPMFISTNLATLSKGICKIVFRPLAPSPG